VARTDAINRLQTDRSISGEIAGATGSGPPGAATDSRSGLGSAGKPLSWWARARRDKVLLLMALPGLVLLLVFHYLPLLGNLIAFQEYLPFVPFGRSAWVGLDNFAVIFNGDAEFLNALKNTLLITLVQVIFVFPAPIALALLLNSLLSERIKRIVQSVLYLPHFLSWVIVVALFQQMLGNAGMLNTFLVQHNWPIVHVIGVPELFKALLTSQAIWKDAGWGTIIFLAAISRIDQEQYEAAAVDGATATQRMFNITLPALKGLFILLLILRLGSSLSVGFEQIILQQGPVGLRASEVLDTWVYNYGILGGNWGVSAAAGLVKGLVGVLLVVGANKLAHVFGERGVYEK
jgi:putative aldouronate transport system permease protein